MPAILQPMMDSNRQDLAARFSLFFRQRGVDLTKPLMAAVSGGVDSVALAELCHQAKIPMVIAHCNFQLRGAESERDEQFVRTLQQRYHCQVLVKKFETEIYAGEKKLSIQEAARALRYDWFRELRKELGCSYTMLAHHADDNIETLLMNFFRGTGLQGLTGMPSATAELLRPMLSFRRREIEEFAKRNSLQWVEDSSNRSSKYTRNFFRNELIPAIGRVFPEVEENLLANIRRFGSVNEYYLSAVRAQLEKIVERRGDETWVPIRKLKKHDYRLLTYELIRGFGFGEKHLDEVLKLMDSPSGKFMQRGNYQLIRHGLWLIIAPVSAHRELVPVDEGTEEVAFAGGLLRLKKLEAENWELLMDGSIAQLDASKLDFPLVLRKWKQGDYFYPLGMKKKKKLSRFFIDIKLPRHHKENSWVLESGGKLIWVVGRRIDDRFKITASTKQVLVINWTSPSTGNNTPPQA